MIEREFREIYNLLEADELDSDGYKHFCMVSNLILMRLVDKLKFKKTYKISYDESGKVSLITDYFKVSITKSEYDNNHVKYQSLKNCNDQVGGRIKSTTLESLNTFRFHAILNNYINNHELAEFI